MNSENRNHGQNDGFNNVPDLQFISEANALMGELKAVPGGAEIAENFEGALRRIPGAVRAMKERRDQLYPEMPMDVDRVTGMLREGAIAHMRSVLSLARRTGTIDSVGDLFKQYDVESGIAHCHSITESDLDAIPNVHFGHVPASELLGRNSHLAQFREEVCTLIRRSFPKKCESEFRSEFLPSKDAEFFYALAGTEERELVAFFGTRKMPAGFTYIDWLFSNPDSKVRSLAGRLISRAMRDPQLKDTDWYAQSKAHVRSLEILIEQAGGVAFGITDPKEAVHRYLRVRRIGDESSSYETKGLTSNETGGLWDMAKEPGEIHSATVLGNPVLFCSVAFTTQNHLNNITPNDPDGWFMKEVQNLGAKGYVLTRYIPASDNSKQHRRYLAIFEKSKASPAREAQLHQSINDHFDLDRDAA